MPKIKEKIKEKENNKNLSKENRTLLLYNDDYHSFPYVTDALIRICKHDSEQALQCTYLVHYTGKSDVQKGSYEFLKPMRASLRELDLKTTID